MSETERRNKIDELSDRYWAAVDAWNEQDIEKLYDELIALGANFEADDDLWIVA